MATDMKWWTGLGGVAGILASQATKTPEKFDDESVKTAVAAGVSVLLIIFVVYLVISILLIVLAYKIFPDYKGLHALMTFLLGLFWLIPAMLYYLFGLKGYHMKGIRIVKRA